MEQHPTERTPLVSVIMIFLNGEKYIAEAIESVLAQTLTDWELVLVDDGTTDGATAVARDFASRHPDRISVIEHPGHANLGMSASRNAGLHAARGRHVAFLDADDVWLPERLAVQAEVIEDHPEVSIVIEPMLYWTSWANATDPAARRDASGQMTGELGLPVGEVLEPPIVAIGYLENGGATVPGICSVLARREDVLAVGGFDPRFRTLYEDQVFFFRMALRYRTIALDSVNSLYRQHEDSACHHEGMAEGHTRARPAFLEWLQDHLIDEGIKDRRIWRALRAEMLPFDRPDLLGVRVRRLLDRIGMASRETVVRIMGPSRYNALRRRYKLKRTETSPPH